LDKGWTSAFSVAGAIHRAIWKQAVGDLASGDADEGVRLDARVTLMNLGDYR
jgi:hypothetical protein